MGRLHTITVGSGPEKLVFLHGVFGQGKNFGTVAKMLGDLTTSVLTDLPNHGRSPWTEQFAYPLFAEMVADELVELGAEDEPVTLVGHSMGGKVAMQTALSHPHLLKRLVVLDMSPVDRGNPAEFQYYVDALCSLDLDAIHSRADADAALREAVPSDSIRMFLLQNLHRSAGHKPWRWLLNVKLMRKSMEVMSGWPDQHGKHWDGPVLWLGGANSRFITEKEIPAMSALFPNYQLDYIADAGHWLHAEQPKAVADALRQFITTT